VTLVVFYYYLKVIPVHDILTVLLEFHCSQCSCIVFLVPHGSNYNRSSIFTRINLEKFICIQNGS
jgi:hypothetical protein